MRKSAAVAAFITNPCGTLVVWLERSGSLYIIDKGKATRQVADRYWQRVNLQMTSRRHDGMERMEPSELCVGMLLRERGLMWDGYV